MSEKTVRPPMGRIAYFPSVAYMDTRLTLLSCAVLGVISAHTVVKRNGWFYLLQRDIAETLGVSRQKVNLHVRLLEQCGYIESRQRFLKTGAQTTSEYRINQNFELPEEFSRLPAAPDEETPGTPPPVTVERHPRHPRVTPVSPQGDTNSGYRGNLKEETLNGDRLRIPPVLNKLPSGARELTRAQIRAWPWLYGVPVRSQRLRVAHVERATNAYEALLRQDIADGHVPDRDTWERAHHWPRGAMPRSSEREREYRMFAAIVGARIAEMNVAPVQSLALVE